MKESSQEPVVSSQEGRPAGLARLARILATGYWLLATSVSSAAWFDAAWPYRRSLEVKWDVERATGEDVAWADVFTAGHANDQGDDLRVATDGGKAVPSKV